MKNNYILDDALHDLSILLYILSLVFMLIFFKHLFKSNRKKIATYVYLMIICFVFGIICRYYHVVGLIVIGIGVLCLLVSGILTVSVFAVGLFYIIKLIVSRLWRNMQKCHERQRAKRCMRLEQAEKRKRNKHIRIEKLNKLKKKQIENFINDIPDDSFFEVQQPPGGLD